ncbi:MAG: hypothetical protein N3G21_03430 [Candidatus Hydrogenedentes bacterium]|nr:hypothetical protein [Candidatus Hydrogenedentota bacterium]
MIQVSLTVQACKRLIAKGILKHPVVQKALHSHTLVVVGGTTNGYVAEEVLMHLGYEEKFPKGKFFRGITLPPWYPVMESGMLQTKTPYPGDVVIEKGTWQKGKMLFDVINQLGADDVVLKGANALDLENRRAGILIGHNQGGTSGAIVPAVVGRKVRMIIPVGLEKRICGSLDKIALKINTSPGNAPRFFPVPGEVFTELDAIKLLTGASAELIGGGGVCGAEGAVWLAIEGSEEQEGIAKSLIEQIKYEPQFKLDVEVSNME